MAPISGFMKALTLVVGPICALGFLFMYVGEESADRWGWLMLSGLAAAMTVFSLLFLRRLRRRR